jgi:LysR family transcriptional regulator, hca operon transcriptional activator
MQLCLAGIGDPVELRHLRYFIAVAEEGSFIHAAERRLHTAQPSLSRQIRDLELEVGVKLLERKARGIVLTAAGQVFLDNARLVLMQLDATVAAARHAEQPKKPGFVVGFLAGQEVTWLSETLRILQEEAPGTEITISSLSSPELANALMQNRMDVALLRRESQTSGLAFKLLVKEPLVVILPANHRLARHKTIRPQQLARERFIAGSTKLAPVLKSVVKEYAATSGLSLDQTYDVENISGGMSLVASSGNLMLLPAYVTKMLVPSVVARPLEGELPTVDLVMGYNKSNASALLKRFLARADDLVAGVQKQSSKPASNRTATKGPAAKGR